MEKGRKQRGQYTLPIDDGRIMNNEHNVSDEPDTDPTIRKSPNGHDKGRPCAVHAAELVTLRDEARSNHKELMEVKENLHLHSKVLEEVRDLTKNLSRAFSDEMERWRERDAEIEKAVLELIAVIGEPPDPTTGKPGTGMRGQWVKAINEVIKSEARRDMPSLMDDESEVTGALDRESLVIAKRKAERDRRVMLVRAIVAGVLAIIGALVTAAVTLIPMLKG